MLKTGITGSTSSLSHDQMSDGRYMIGRSFLLAISFAYAGREIKRGRRGLECLSDIHLPPPRPSTTSPPGHLGTHPPTDVRTYPPIYLPPPPTPTPLYPATTQPRLHRPLGREVADEPLGRGRLDPVAELHIGPARLGARGCRVGTGVAGWMHGVAGWMHGVAA